MFKRIILSFLIISALIVSFAPVRAASGNQMIGINVVLNTGITDSLLADLGTHGKVRDVVAEINAVTMQVASSELEVIQALPYVEYANPDAKRNGAPVDTVEATDFTNGMNTWDLDAINVTNINVGRTIGYDGTGVYVAVLDTGLLDSWRQYFPDERIATEFAKSFSGGGGEMGNVSEQPNKWEHDQNSHGTHVTSTILGYKRTDTVNFNGVAPMATVIPVKVLNQNGSGWSSVIARGIVYIADLKDNGDLGDSPVVINMSLGGPSLDAMEKAAIDYAIEKGVIIVASAGNNGSAGMGYPGAYAPVISVAASGWTGEWTGQRTNPALSTYYRYWWYLKNVTDPTMIEQFYITSFSSRQLTGQDLDVAAPGSWIVGPYQVNSGQISYYFLGGTSMASPHVAGIVALMLQKNHTLTASQAETILENSAVNFVYPSTAPYQTCRGVYDPAGTLQTICWKANASGHGLVTADAALAATP